MDAERVGNDVLRLVLDVAPCAIVVVGTDGSISMANREAERLFGYGSGDLVGHSVEDLVPDELGDSHSNHRAQFTARPSSRPMGRQRDLTGRRRDGTTFPVEEAMRGKDLLFICGGLGFVPVRSAM